MKKQFALACLSAVILFAVFVTATSCTKEPPKPLDLNSINGRWAQIGDTTAHFYIDSLTPATSVLRYPTQLQAPLTTYTRSVYNVDIKSDTVYLRANEVPGKYNLFKKGGKWYGQVFMQNIDNQIEAIEIMQLDNNTDQPGPDTIKPL